MKRVGRLFGAIIWEATYTFLGLFGVIACVKAAVSQQPLKTQIELWLFSLFAIVIVYAVLGVFWKMLLLTAYEVSERALYAIPGFTEKRFLREIDRSPRIDNVLLCSDAICHTDKRCIIMAIPIQDIVWAYKEEVQQEPCIQIYTKDGMQHSIPVSIKPKFGTADAACRYILRLIARKNTGALIGYDESYEVMRKNAFNQLLTRVQQGEIIDSRLLEQEYIRKDYYTKDLQ